MFAPLRDGTRRRIRVIKGILLLLSAGIIGLLSTNLRELFFPFAGVYLVFAVVAVILPQPTVGQAIVVTAVSWLVLLLNIWLGVPRLSLVQTGSSAVAGLPVVCGYLASILTQRNEGRSGLAVFFGSILAVMGVSIVLASSIGTTSTLILFVGPWVSLLFAIPVIAVLSAGSV